MKSFKLLFAAVVAVGFAVGSASAYTGTGTAGDPYVINVVGSTAFRAGAQNSMLHSLTSNATYAYAGTSFSGASSSIFKGKIGTDWYTIRAAWSGSVEGIRDVAQQNNVNFLPTSTTTSAGGTSGATGTAAAKPDFTFTDAYVASTPYASYSLDEQQVCVLPFCFLANHGATLTNVTNNAYQGLVTGGSQALSFFTGNSSDTDTVYATGRNDGSGTRLTALAVTGKGWTGLINQYKITASSGNITAVTIWPTGDGSNASTIFNTDTTGNGGYSSGSASTGLVAALSNNAPAGTQVLGYAGSADSYSGTQNTPSVKVLSYEGVTLTPTSTGFSNPEVVYNGAYTFWCYEHLDAGSGTLGATGPMQTFNTAIRAQIPSYLTNVALDSNLMGVFRGGDGQAVAP